VDVLPSPDLPVPVVVDRDDDPATEAWHRMRAISHSPTAMAAFQQLVVETGLPVAALRALLVLPPADPVPMRELATRLGCDSSYATGIVDTLEQHRLAVRQPHPTDRRIKDIALTPHGVELARRAQLADTTPPESFGNLSATEIRTLRDLLRRIGTD
jgi:DNA-binding MarR family transcriptional regulator